MNVRCWLGFGPLMTVVCWSAPFPGQAQQTQRDGPVSALYIPPISPFPNWYEVRAGSWRVPLATLHELRIRIDAEIGRNKYFQREGMAASYAIQFRGETLEGHQVVRLVGACNAGERSEWKLSEQFIQVRDGGKCYFEADYRLQDRQFRLRYHGNA